MRARAVNQHYLGQNTLRDLDAEYAAGGAANQSHAPRAASPRQQESSAEVLENHNELSLVALKCLRATEPPGNEELNCAIYR